MDKKKYIKLTILIIIFIALSLGATYAFLNIQKSNNNTTGTAGCFDISYTGTEIKHTNLSVTTNYLEGVNSTVTIAKDASCKIYNEAYIYIHVNDDITAPIETVQALRYKVMQGNNQIGEGLITNKGEVLLATVPITTTSTTYNIYIWVDSSLSNKQYDNVKFTGYIYAESDQTSTIENTRTVTFNPNGGSVSPTTKQVLYRHPYESLPTPTRSGYTFKGWSIDTTGYKKLEYLEGTGTQYIDSGVHPSANLDVLFDGGVTGTYAGWMPFFGWRGSPSYSSDFSFWLYSSNTFLASDYGQTVGSGRFPTNYTHTTRFTFGNVDNDFYYNNSKIVTMPEWTKTTEPGTCYIFGMNTNGRFENRGNTVIRVYSLKMWENKSLVRDFVPALNTTTNKYGLYDKVNCEFYDNKGTGTFNYGSNLGNIDNIVSSNSIVNLNKNHTLTAIWE